MLTFGNDTDIVATTKVEPLNHEDEYKEKWLDQNIHFMHQSIEKGIRTFV